MSKIIVNHASVEFPIYQRGTYVTLVEKSRGPGGLIARYRNKRPVVKALDNISFQLEAGDRVGVVGHNGAGKSTLLRLLAGIYEPVSGTVHTEGVIAPMLSLSQGIEKEATGYENITIRGIFLGMTTREIKKQQQEIADFSELGEYLSMPVRTYSSGMLVRLAFAISACIKPDILLLDEVFGAGDKGFKDKARDKMYELIAQAKIIVFATHSFDLMQQFCNKVLVMQAGRILDYNTIDAVMKKHQVLFENEQQGMNKRQKDIAVA
jgi:ABC-type polysaccharide/polyol phosphate transport system ATPase subunit